MHAVSVSKLAEQLNLPRLFVDIRHDATHGQLPALPMLQFAAKQALEWLHANYWREQERSVVNNPKRVRKYVRRYKVICIDSRHSLLILVCRSD